MGLYFNSTTRAIVLGCRELLRRFVRTWAHFIYLLEFGSGMLNGNSFDTWSDRLFHPTRGFLHWRAFGLGLGNRSLRWSSLAEFS